MTIKYSKDVVSFANTEKDSTSLSNVYGYNEFLNSTSLQFDVPPGSPFRFRKSGDVTWQYSNTEDIGNVLAVDSEDSGDVIIPSNMIQHGDNFYTCGIFADSSAGTYNVFLRELDRSGTELQSAVFDVGNTTYAAAYTGDGMVIRDGYIYLAGNTTTYAKVYKVDITDFTTSTSATWTVYDKTEISEITATDEFIYLCGKVENAAVWSGIVGMISIESFGNITIDDSKVNTSADIYTICAKPDVGTDIDLVVIGMKTAASIIQFAGLKADKSTSTLSTGSVLGFEVHPNTVTPYDASCYPKRLLYDSSDDVCYALITDSDGVSSDIYRVVPKMGAIADSATPVVTYDDSTLICNDIELNLHIIPHNADISTSTVLWRTVDTAVANVYAKLWINASDKLELIINDGASDRVAWYSDDTQLFEQYHSQIISVNRDSNVWTVTLNGTSLDITLGSSDYDKLPITMSDKCQFAFATSNVTMYGASLEVNGNPIYNLEMDNPLNPNYNSSGTAVSTGLTATYGASEATAKESIAATAMQDIAYYNGDLYIVGAAATGVMYLTKRTPAVTTFTSVWTKSALYNGATGTGKWAVALCVDDDTNISSGGETFEEALYVSYMTLTVSPDYTLYRIMRLSTDGLFDINAEEFEFQFSPTTEGLAVDEVENSIAGNELDIRGLCIAIITTGDYPYGLLQMDVGYRDNYKYQTILSTQSVTTYRKKVSGDSTPCYFYHPDGYMVQDDVYGDYVANSPVSVSLQSTISDNDYEAYVDTINIYYDPTGMSRAEIEDSTIDIWVQTAISMVRAELYTTADSNYDFNTEYEYFELGEEVETARIPSTYAVDMNDTYCAGRKQVEVMETTLDAKDSKCIKLRVKARLTDEDGANRKFDDWVIYNINILPRGNIYLEGNDA